MYCTTGFPEHMGWEDWAWETPDDSRRLKERGSSIQIDHERTPTLGSAPFPQLTSPSHSLPQERRHFTAQVRWHDTRITFPAREASLPPQEQSGVSAKVVHKRSPPPESCALRPILRHETASSAALFTWGDTTQRQTPPHRKPSCERPSAWSHPLVLDIQDLDISRGKTHLLSARPAIHNG